MASCPDAGAYPHRKPRGGLLTPKFHRDSESFIYAFNAYSHIFVNSVIRLLQPATPVISTFPRPQDGHDAIRVPRLLSCGATRLVSGLFPHSGRLFASPGGLCDKQRQCMCQDPKLETLSLVTSRSRVPFTAHPRSVSRPECPPHRVLPQMGCSPTLH